MRNNIFPQMMLPDLLAAQGIECWIDTHDMTGEAWESSARRGMAESSCHLVLVDEFVSLDLTSSAEPGEPGSSSGPDQLSDGASAFRPAAKPIRLELEWACESGLSTIYMAVDGSDKQGFLTRAAKESQSVPLENVLCVMDDRDGWLDKLVRTVRKLAKFSYPEPLAWVAHGLSDGSKALSVDRIGVCYKRPEPLPGSGIATVPQGYGVVRAPDRSPEVFDFAGSAVLRSRIIRGSIAADQVPVSSHWSVTGQFVTLFAGSSGWSSWAISKTTGDAEQLSGGTEATRDAAWFAGRPIRIDLDLELLDGPNDWMLMSDSVRWLSIDSMNAGSFEAVVALGQSGPLRQLFIRLKDGHGERDLPRCDVGPATSARIVPGSKGSLNIALAGPESITIERLSLDD